MAGMADVAPEDDFALLDRWSSGDSAAGNALFKKHFTAVYRFFEHKADGDIDELVQDTFLACVRGRSTFRRQSTFRTYLFAIARHSLYAYWRKRRKGAVDVDEVSIASLSTSVGSRLARRQDRARLLTALRELPMEQQLLLELHYWEGLDGERIAEVFDVEPATTRSRLFRARAALRERLSAEGGAAPADADLDAWARELQRDDDAPPA